MGKRAGPVLSRRDACYPVSMPYARTYSIQKSSFMKTPNNQLSGKLQTIIFGLQDLPKANPLEKL